MLGDSFMTYEFEMGPIRPPERSPESLDPGDPELPLEQVRVLPYLQGGDVFCRPVEEVKRDIDRVKAIVDEIRELSWKAGRGGEIDQAVLRSYLSQPGRQAHTFQSVAGWLYFGGAQVFLQDGNSLMVNTATSSRSSITSKSTSPPSSG